MPLRSDRYFLFGTSVLVLAGIVVAINGNLYSAATLHARYSFWTSGIMIVGYALGGLAIVLFVSGALGVPFPPWRKPKFPDLEFRISKIMLHADPTSGDLWSAFRVTIVNREMEQNAIVDIGYRARLRAGHISRPDGGEWGETPFVRADREDIPPTFPSERLVMPVTVRPQHAVTGFYIATLEPPWTSGITDKAALLVQEIASDKAIVIPTETGTFAKGGDKVSLANQDADGYWRAFEPPD